MIIRRTRQLKSFGFMADPASPFGKLPAGAEAYPELPFTVSVSKGAEQENRIDTSGRIDLALCRPDGTWRIPDYQTDRRLPTDCGGPQAFRARLNQGDAQPETCRLILESVAGNPVVEPMPSPG